MRILCIIDSFERGGGAQTQLAGLARLLCGQGNQVKALSYHYFPAERSFQKKLEKAGVEYVCVTGAEHKLSKLTELYREIGRYRPQVVIAYLEGPAIIGCLIKILKSGFSLIVSERSVTQKIGIKERIKFFLYRKADAVVTNSFTQQKFIQDRFPFLVKKLYTITNFVDTDYFKPVLRKKNRLLHFVVVARVTEVKNVLLFLDALKIAANAGVKFVVDWYGLIYSEYHAKCVEKIRRLKLEHYIQFYGAVEDVRKVYKGADAFCLPSWFEGCPNGICEAMSSGLPILCSRVCDNPFLVEEGKNGYLFDPSSAEDMAETMIRFVQLPETEKEKMGIVSREMALKKLSKEVFVQRYMSVFHVIAGL